MQQKQPWGLPQTQPWGLLQTPQTQPWGRASIYRSDAAQIITIQAAPIWDNMMKQLILNQMTLENQMGTLSKDLIYNINALYAKVTKLEKNIETLKNLKTT